MKLNEKPFYLSEKDIEWVKETLASMSVEEKIGQLFCLTDMITDEEQLKEMIRKYKGDLLSPKALRTAARAL